MSLSGSNDYTIANCEGTSSIKLFSALDLTCKKFISSIKFSLFKTKYQNIYRKSPETLRNLCDELRTVLKKSISEDLDELSKEHKIEFLLNTLDAIKKNQDTAQKSWRPSGDPEEDLRDHIYPIKLQEKEALEEMLSKLKLDNEELFNVAAVNHAEIMHMKQTNDNLHEKFTNIITSLTGPNYYNLKHAIVSKLDITG